MLLIGRERGKGQIGKITGPSPSKSGKSWKNRESPKKGRTSPDRETPLKRGQTCTFQTCTLFSARLLALTTSRLPSMPSSPPLLSIASTLSELKWAITSPKKGQATQKSGREQSARSKGACLSPLDPRLKPPCLAALDFIAHQADSPRITRISDSCECTRFARIVRIDSRESRH